jgi:lipopolysaccharide export system protein LptC
MRERSTLITSLVLLGSLAGGSYWLAVRARLGDPTARPLAHEVDYFSENFTLTRMDDKGAALYDVASAVMKHYADDDSTVLDKPQITSVRANQPTVRMSSDTGNVTSDAEQVTLSGHVQMVRAATDTDAELRGKGTVLVVFPEQDIAKSDEPFELVHGGSKVWARNMVFDNTHRVIRMNEGIEARGLTIMEPQQRHGAPTPSDSKAQP